MQKLSGFPTRKELHDLKRREIVRCAAEKFGKEGYENVPLDAIAAELGVTKAALYNYVSSKHELLMQCYDAGMDSLIESVETSMATPGTAAVRLEAVLNAYMLTMTRKDMQYLWSAARPTVTAGKDRWVHEKRDKIDALFREILQDGIRDGSLRPDLEPKLASFVILGAINWVSVWFRKEGGFQPADIASDIMRGYLAK